MLPLRSLSLRSSSSRFARPPRDDGMLPLRSLSSSRSCCRFVRLPSEDGMLPLRSLSSSRSCCRFVRLPSEDGMLPLRSLLSRSQPPQICEVAQLRRYAAAQIVVVESQLLQICEAAQGRRNRSVQLLVLEDNPQDALRGPCRESNSFPVPDWGVLRPVETGCAAERVLSRQQSNAVAYEAGVRRVSNRPGRAVRRGRCLLLGVRRAIGSQRRERENECRQQSQKRQSRAAHRCHCATLQLGAASGEIHYSACS